MKEITAEDVRKLRQETGEGLMACKKILEDRCRAEEKAKMIDMVDEIGYSLNRYHVDTNDVLDDIHKVLQYLVRNV